MALIGEPTSVAERWVAAMNKHDLDGAVDCFAADYHDQAPARRGESVTGEEEVRRNFLALFSNSPIFGPRSCGPSPTAPTCGWSGGW